MTTIVATTGLLQAVKPQAGQTGTWRPSMSRGSIRWPHSWQNFAVISSSKAYRGDSPLRPADRRGANRRFILASALDLIHFEDLELGGRWATRGRTVTDADIAAHAGVSGDFGFLHVDAPRAAQSHFGGRVAHGSLLISIALGLGSMDVPQPNTVALVGSTWRFLKPVKPGMTVHAVWRLGRKRDVSNPHWGLAVWQVELDDENSERVLEGEVSILVNRRDVASAAGPRSRRRRRGKAPVLAAAVTAEANLPEPAPADTPSPASRRRRTSKPPAGTEPPVAPVATESAPEPVPAAEPAAPSSSSRRRRRRRGGGGGGGGASAGSVTATAGEASLAGSAPAAVQEPAPAAEPPRSQWAAPEPAQPAAPAKPADGNPVSRVFGRLRRPRAAPAPEGTRSPSE
jgi:3-hydroxybutyryl-CoA dehydratase